MSIQDMIKKSVLESGVFDSFNAPKMAISLIIALLLGAVIYMVYSKFYVGVIFSRSFAVTLVGMTLLTCMVTLAISTNEHCDLTWYGRSVVYRSFPYSGERSDGSAISFLGDHYRNHNRSRNVCAGSDRGSCDDRDDLSVLS